MAKRKRKRSKEGSVLNAMVAILIVLVVSAIGTWGVQSADTVQDAVAPHNMVGTW